MIQNPYAMNYMFIISIVWGKVCTMEFPKRITFIHGMSYGLCSIKHIPEMSFSNPGVIAVMWWP